MKRKLVCLALICCAALALAVPAMAEDIEAETKSVTYTAGKELVEDYSETIDIESNMQPGDTLIQKITLKNESSAATDWYISNEVLESLEDNSEASGGAYTYVLIYTSGNEEREIYNSESVGGEDSENGLADATQGLEDYVYLGEIAAGGSAAVTLKIGLDGMTQINSYQNTSASVRMNFAVEEAADVTNTTVVTAVKTGDWMQTMPFILLTALCGVALLALAAVSLRKSKKN